MQVESHLFYYIPLPKLFSCQFDQALRKDMSSFYIVLEKPTFLSLGDDSGGKTGRNNCVEFMFKTDTEK